MTSGGTESCLMACKAYRDLARVVVTSSDLPACIDRLMLKFCQFAFGYD